MFYLQILRGPPGFSNKTFPLTKGSLSIGRSSQNDIQIPDPKISGQHLQINFNGESVDFLDKGSTNGTSYLGKRITSGSWQTDKTLVLGDTEIQLRAKEAPVSNPPVSSPANPPSSTRFLDDPGGLGFSVLAKKKIDGLTEVQWDQIDLSNSPQLKRLLKRLRVIGDVSKYLRSVLNIEDLLDRIMLKLFEVMNCESGYILLLDSKDHHNIISHLAYEQGLRIPNPDTRLYSKTLVDHVIQQRVGFIFDQDEGSQINQAMSIVNLSIKNAIVCPIHAENRIFGIIYLDNKKGRLKYVEEDLDLLISIAGLAGVAVENVQLYDKLHNEAIIRNNLKRFVSPNIAEKMIADPNIGQALFQSTKRDVAILFADIRGFTKISESCSSMEVVRLLNTYFNEMCRIIFNNGGTLDKFIGDCMMVVFGAPFNLEKQEILAVKTAIEMQVKLRQLLPDWKIDGIPEFQIGIGINCGEVTIGSIGTETRMEYTSIGDNVNIASRLCGIATPGQIVISRDLQERLQGAFDSRPLEAVQLKGKSQKLDIFEVTIPPTSEKTKS